MERNELRQAASERETRRDFLRTVAATGAAVWVAPLIETVAATPAYAQTQGTPTPGACFHSEGDSGGCMGACGGVCGGDQCGGFSNPSGTQVQGPCTTYCPPGTGGDNPCCNPGLCVAGNFTCSPDQHGAATYNGPLDGC